VSLKPAEKFEAPVEGIMTASDSTLKFRQRRVIIGIRSCHDSRFTDVASVAIRHFAWCCGEHFRFEAIFPKDRYVVVSTSVGYFSHEYFK
jgi:hypothetical protein